MLSKQRSLNALFCFNLLLLRFCRDPCLPWICCSVLIVFINKPILLLYKHLLPWKLGLRFSDVSRLLIVPFHVIHSLLQSIKPLVWVVVFTYHFIHRTSWPARASILIYISYIKLMFVVNSKGLLLRLLFGIKLIQSCKIVLFKSSNFFLFRWENIKLRTHRWLGQVISQRRSSFSCFLRLTRLRALLFLLRFRYFIYWCLTSWWVEPIAILLLLLYWDLYCRRRAFGSAALILLVFSSLFK